MVKCEHGAWPGVYCDPCEREYLDRMEARAWRTSHDTTPMMPVWKGE